MNNLPEQAEAFTSSAASVTDNYVVDCANGTKLGSFGSYDAAVAACQARWPAAVIGHDGDLTDNGDRTLVWACEADSIDDAGARAVAVIRAERFGA